MVRGERKIGEDRGERERERETEKERWDITSPFSTLTRLCALARVRITDALFPSFGPFPPVRRARFRTFSYFLFVNKQSGAARRGVVAAGCGEARRGHGGGGETINHFN